VQDQADFAALWTRAVAGLPAPARGLLAACPLIEVEGALSSTALFRVAIGSALMEELLAPHHPQLLDHLASALQRPCALAFVVDPERCPVPVAQRDLDPADDTVLAGAEAPLAAGAIGYYARILAQVGLPYRRPKTSEFVRQNGRLRVSFTAPAEIGLPYGVLPRLLLCWLSTEAVRSRSRELTLGHTLSEFLTALGLNRTGGPRGDISRLRRQMASLFASTVTAFYSGPGETGIRTMPFADQVFLWWDPIKPTESVLWNSTILLSEPFYTEIVEHPIPVAMPVLRTLRRAPLALDLYVWLSHRLYHLTAPTIIPTGLLLRQFGAAETVTVREFKRNLQEALVMVRQVWPELRIDVTPPGLRLWPSPLSVPRQRLR